LTFTDDFTDDTDDEGFHILLQNSSVIRPHAIHIGWLNAKPGLFG